MDLLSPSAKINNNKMRIKKKSPPKARNPQPRQIYFRCLPKSNVHSKWLQPESRQIYSVSTKSTSKANNFKLAEERLTLSVSSNSKLETNKLILVRETLFFSPNLMFKTNNFKQSRDRFTVSVCILTVPDKQLQAERKKDILSSSHNNQSLSQTNSSSVKTDTLSPFLQNQRPQ